MSAWDKPIGIAWNEARPPLTSAERSKRHRAKSRAEAAAARPHRDARVIAAARAVVSAAARDDWTEAHACAAEIRAIYNPDKDPPIPAVEVLLRSLVWISEVEAFGDAAALLEDSSFSVGPDPIAFDFEGETPAPRRRVDDALGLLHAATVNPDPDCTRFTFYSHVCEISDGMKWRLLCPVQHEQDGYRPFHRAATTFVRNYAKALGGGPIAEWLARRIVLVLEHPGQVVIIPKQRNLRHPLAAIALTDDAWSALHRVCLGSNGRSNVSALVAPSTCGSGQRALARARAFAEDFPEIVSWAEREGRVAEWCQLTPKLARALVREREAADEIPF